MEELARFALVTLTSVLFIVDPIAAVPTYLIITQDETPPSVVTRLGGPAWR